MQNLIYGDKNRIFINTALGCNSKCSYCYLPDIGIDNQVKYFKAKYIIKQIEKMEQFQRGKDGTIISIGCYSECWDIKNKDETIKLVKYFIDTGNYVQLATKKEITYDELQEINKLIKYKNQLNIYISIPTISKSNLIEIGTDKVEKRISNFKLKSCLKNINFILYIKPVLRCITKLDVKRYIDIIEEYKLDVVVGDLLSIKSNSKIISDVGEKMLYEYKVDDAVFIKEQLSDYTKVYTHSTEVILNDRNLRRE